MNTTWTETDALAARRAGDRAAAEANAAILAADQADSIARRSAAMGLPAEAPAAPVEVPAARPALTLVPDLDETDQDVPAVEVGEIPAEAPCSHPSCAHAAPHTPCRCTFCLGAGHGWIVARQQEAARARAAARYATAGGVFEHLRLAGGLADLDDPFADLVPSGPARGLSAVAFDADGWPIG